MLSVPPRTEREVRGKRERAPKEHFLLAATGAAGRGKVASEPIKASTSKVREERTLAAAEAGGGRHPGTAPGTLGPGCEWTVPSLRHTQSSAEEVAL